ncbi:hypothetical protein MRX96_004326 [Rhipicephalus microplus]
MQLSRRDKSERAQSTPVHKDCMFKPRQQFMRSTFPAGTQAGNLGAAQYARGAPQYASGAPSYAGGAPQYAGGAPPYAGGAPQYAGGAPQYAGGAPQYAGGAAQYAGGAAQYAGAGGLAQYGGAPTPAVQYAAAPQSTGYGGGNSLASFGGAGYGGAAQTLRWGTQLRPERGPGGRTASAERGTTAATHRSPGAGRTRRLKLRRTLHHKPKRMQHLKPKDTQRHRPRRTPRLRPRHMVRRRASLCPSISSRRHHSRLTLRLNSRTELNSSNSRPTALECTVAGRPWLSLTVAEGPLALQLATREDISHMADTLAGLWPPIQVQILSTVLKSLVRHKCTFLLQGQLARVTALVPPTQGGYNGGSAAASYNGGGAANAHQGVALQTGPGGVITGAALQGYGGSSAGAGLQAYGGGSGAGGALQGYGAAFQGYGAGSSGAQGVTYSPSAAYGGAQLAGQGAPGVHYASGSTLRLQAAPYAAALTAGQDARSAGGYTARPGGYGAASSAQVTAYGPPAQSGYKHKK